MATVYYYNEKKSHSSADKQQISLSAKKIVKKIASIHLSVPENMLEYIEDVNFMIGRSRTKPTSCSCVSLGNKLYLTFSRKIKEAEFERIFFSKLVEMGIPVEIESNRGR